MRRANYSFFKTPVLARRGGLCALRDQGHRTRGAGIKKYLRSQRTVLDSRQGRGSGSLHLPNKWIKVSIFI